jgi:hypothetical protein
MADGDAGNKAKTVSGLFSTYEELEPEYRAGYSPELKRKGIPRELPVGAVISLIAGAWAQDLDTVSLGGTILNTSNPFGSYYQSKA